MFILVLFTDDVFLICEPEDIKAFTTTCPAVMYTDGRRYTARIIALSDDPELLRKIQKSFETELEIVSFKNIRYSEENLSYGDILKNHTNYQDAHILYLDSTIFSQRSTNIKDCILQLQEQRQTKKFFKCQSQFIQGKVLETEDRGSEKSHTECTTKDQENIMAEKKSSIDFTGEKITLEVNADDKIIVADKSTEHASKARALVEVNAIHCTLKHCTINEHYSALPAQILDDEESEHESKSQLSDKVIAYQQDHGHSFSDNDQCLSSLQLDHNINTFKTTTADDDCEDKKKFMEEHSSEYLGAVRVFVENNTMSPPAEICAIHENSSILTVKVAQRKKAEHDRDSGLPNDENANPQILGLPDSDKGGFSSSLNITDNNKSTSKTTTANGHCEDKSPTERKSSEYVSEVLVLVKEETINRASENHIIDYTSSISTAKICEEKEKTEHDHENQLLDEVNINQSIDPLKKKMKNLNEKERLLDDRGFDENCNWGTINLNNIEFVGAEVMVAAEVISDMPINKSDSGPETGRAFVCSDKNALSVINTENVVHKPNTTYGLDLMDLELSPSQLVNDVMISEEMIQTSTSIDGNNTSLPSSLTLSRPIGNSTTLDISKPCTSYGIAISDEGSEDEDHSSSDDYVPSATESTDTDASLVGNEVAKTSNTSDGKQIKNKSSLNITFGLNKPGVSAPDDVDLQVTTSASGSYTKKHFCFYCHKFQSKLARHLELVHKDEDDVKKFSALPPKNLERTQIISAIRKNGNHLYNTDRRFNKGQLLVVRRPQERMRKTAIDFIACGSCRGQYARTVIRHHFARCVKRSGKNERIVMVKGRKISARVHEKANKLVRKHIMPYLREDAVVRGIRYDKLVILFANKQCEKYGLHHHHYQMVRARIRLLGRFLMAIKERNTEIQEFSDVFQPRNYDDSIEAVKKVAGFEEDTRTFACPSTASNLGTLLKHVGEILRSEYIKEEMAADQKRVEDFLKLQSENFGTSVNRAVMETQAQHNRRKKVLLPSQSDITKLHNYLTSEREMYFNQLNEKFCENAWRKLAEVLVITLQLFNRRRPGEMERVYLEDFNSYQCIDKIADKDKWNSLSKEGKALAQKYVRFMARGKRGRGVAVLVPANLMDPLNLMIKYRAQAGVGKNNEYLFGVPSKDEDRPRWIGACNLMRYFAQKCGADLPSTLRGTQLRKHVATKCMSLNLDENQVSDLANFMGHADRIHREIYRQPVIEKDIITISQLLEKARGTEDNDEEDSDESTGETGNVSFHDTQGNATVGDCSKKSGNTSYPSTNREQLSYHRAKVIHRRWTEEERTTVLGAFENIIRSGRMPTGEDMQKLIDANNCLKGREVAQLRTWLHTQKKKR